MQSSHWKAKLAAWTHDPAEKALVLLRDPSGHERGTVAELQRDIFGTAGLPESLREAVQKADRWAAAADRPQWPRMKADGPYADWTQVRFTERPILIHPLSGQEYDLGKLQIPVEQIKAVSLNHFEQLVMRDSAGTVDARRTALAFWRFGPNTPAADLGALWELLPADTRVPDHTIWAHLDLSSALATAFHADPDGNPALLGMSFGPVQDFIAQARTTSDLWAGSHLLSRIAWEGLRVICEELGPDCVLFPQLRGVPQVDVWLRDEMKLPAERFAGEEWAQGQTDANPLFAAALPNKFVAIVPAGQAEALARRITERVRDWTQRQANAALARLLDKAGNSIADASPARDQIAQQLAGFPEVHWAAVPWSPLVVERERQAPEVSSLTETLDHFYPKEPANAPGFLDSPAWKLLNKELKLPDGATFFSPNAGVLYPALYDLLDRLQAAAKSVREFQQLPQEGYRCSLCGEREWLTHDRDLLRYSPRQRTDTLWAKVQGSAWARKGEHLCAPCTLKRLWPNLFVAEIADVLERKPSRYVISIHVMALTTTLDRWLAGMQGNAQPMHEDVLSLAGKLQGFETVALPKRLADDLRRQKVADPVRDIAERLPAYLDFVKETDQAATGEDELGEHRKLIERVLGAKPETYYALIMMDGDSMGAWLSGTEPRYQLTYRETWHPQIRAGVAERVKQAGGDLARYPDQLRPVSPARHMAVSAALNSFALRLARYIVEDIGKGKLLYAGGDDVLAMISVDDLLPVMFLLRLAYSGVFPAQAERGWDALGVTPQDRGVLRQIGGGFLRFRDALYRVMGHKATASAGAVVAHHQAPLAHVLRTLRCAEKRAKDQGGRDAFAIDLLKRSGGAIQLTCPWLLPRDAEGRADWSGFAGANLETTPMGQLIRLRDRFAGEDFSRRAAYLTQGWLDDMPNDPAALETMLAYQFQRQTQGDRQNKQISESLGHSLAQLAQAVKPKAPADFIRDFLVVAEFLAREGRVGKKGPTRHVRENAV
ncbi:MAG: type III-B CRISPR-associated protein Cas10/Cmr2 [Candidatus Competibacter sp.]|nr:type III-B CRISPR-associated protein Cas10/Cmr2 [Candidatus Competibacter sp.]MDG4605630.1 type III-B CRISPR-associated protein Cas10/Cmr2 [Candidatus Contendobacter sp.]HRD50423.1 type III-B CRISPR-associated protein Cas10/Cmr2 [Candidatus Contendobacter sp.]